MSIIWLDTAETSVPGARIGGKCTSQCRKKKLVAGGSLSAGTNARRGRSQASQRASGTQSQCVPRYVVPGLEGYGAVLDESGTGVGERHARAREEARRVLTEERERERAAREAEERGRGG